jgi:hypothetical protein
MRVGKRTAAAAFGLSLTLAVACVAAQEGQRAMNKGDCTKTPVSQIPLHDRGDTEGRHRDLYATRSGGITRDQDDSNEHVHCLDLARRAQDLITYELDLKDNGEAVIIKRTEGTQSR